MAKPAHRAKLFRQFDEHIEKDYDPEAPTAAIESSGSEGSEDERAGTEHYEKVGKSRLRHKSSELLGPQYRGSRITREALEDEDDEEQDDESDTYDDFEEANLAIDTADASDSEINSENALGESDGEKLNKFVFRGSSNPKRPNLSNGKSNRAKAADFMSASGDEEEEEAEGGEGAELEDSDESDNMDDGLEALALGGETSDEEDDSEEEDDEDDNIEDDDDDEDEDEERVAGDTGPALVSRPATVALSTRDAEKGIAIQQQRKMYDAILNLRIRLQKALIASNSFSMIDDADEVDTEQPYEAAEEAAVKLLNTISRLRENFGPTSSTRKRKRGLSVSMSSQEVWSQIQEDDKQASPFRNETLEKWSRKVESVNVTTTKSLGSRKKTLVGSLQAQLHNPDSRLVNRTRVPRSCAPAQAAKKLAEDEDIYDDADFYQQLLKELVEQRTVDGSSSAGAAAVPSVVLTAARDSKPRKAVDRKASKGRKMRFTVHEKLQNFMAPEDRRTWEQDAIDRFFGTLFGRKMELNEDEGEGEGEGDGEEMDGVVDSNFRIFGN